MDHPAFYVPVGDDAYESTPATASPWDTSLQHGGPPAALLARAIERTRPDPDMPITRISVDFLGGIPQGRLRTEAEVVRPGRRVELVRATLLAGDTPVVAASAWRIRRTEGSTAEQASPAPAPPALPDPQEPEFFPGVPADWGYGNAVEWRYVTGSSARPGPATVWTRVRIPLVAGEEPTGLHRLLVVADSANGVSGELPLAEWLFIPPTVTVTVQRAPDADWMLLDARSTTGPDGIGLAQATMSDDHGLLATVAQPLLVARRG